MEAKEEFQKKKKAKESILFTLRKHKKYIMHINIAFVLFSAYLYLASNPP
jgi:hypothetical protein